MKHVTSSRIREIDALAREKYGIPSIALMENAGSSLASEIVLYFRKRHRPIGVCAFFCGKGNNGGDGFVAARHLASMGAGCVIYLLFQESGMRAGDALTNLAAAKKMGIPVKNAWSVKAVTALKREIPKYGAVVDAIFGTGFRGAPSGHVKSVIDIINTARCPVFSVDVPSGLDATTGRAEAFIRADVTVTFGLPKKGFLLGKGPGAAGRVSVRNISYPRGLLR